VIGNSSASGKEGVSETQERQDRENQGGADHRWRLGPTVWGPPKKGERRQLDQRISAYKIVRTRTSLREKDGLIQGIPGENGIPGAQNIKSAWVKRVFEENPIGRRGEVGNNLERRVLVGGKFTPTSHNIKSEETE